MINLSTEKTQYCCSDNRFQKQKHLTKFQSPLFATITCMRKFADFTLYILKCRVVPSFIHLVMSAMFIWTYSYVSYSMQLFKYFFLASSACVTLRREFLSCQFQLSLRTSMKIELILAKSACFTTPVNIQEMTICPLHRERLGIGWRRSIIQCSVPEELSGHDDTAKQKAERGCTLLQSKLILQATENIRSSWFR